MLNSGVKDRLGGVCSENYRLAVVMVDGHTSKGGFHGFLALFLSHELWVMTSGLTLCNLEKPRTAVAL